MVACHNEGKLRDKLGRLLVRCAGKAAVRELVWGLGRGELGMRAFMFNTTLQSTLLMHRAHQGTARVQRGSLTRRSPGPGHWP